jgi:hypothetical protein
MFISKQDLKAIPFQILHEKVTLATHKIKFDMGEMELQQYELMLKDKIRTYEDLHKTKYLGDIREQYPFVPVDQEVIDTLIVKTRLDIIEDVVKTLGLKTKAGWLMPQIAAYIAKMELPRVGGKVNIREFLKLNFAIDDWHKGLYLYLMHSKRGSLIPTQISPEYKNYSALVPLILAPFKRFNGVNYSDWDTPDLKLVVDANLHQAMRCNVVVEATAEEILKVRELGLVVQSGKSAGEARNPSTYHKLYHLQGTPLQDLPWLAQVMAAQIWVAHPVNRTQLMVLDWLNWDSMPEPLITTEVLPSTKLKAEVASLPWDD